MQNGKPEQEDFLNLLEKTKKQLLLKLPQLPDPAKLSGKEFENLTTQTMVEAAAGSAFESRVEHTGDGTFPDIVVASHWGIEVKSTQSDKWVSVGNSVQESTRHSDVKEIYLLFGKLGGDPDVRYKKYDECLPEVKVTHSPRYMIDMDIRDGDSIFDKMGVTYDKLRGPGAIEKVKVYYSQGLKDGDRLWWVGNNAEDRALSPVIKTFSSLEPEEKRKVIVEVMVKFPEIFSQPKGDYGSAATFLVAERGLVSSSLRDEFSAGGRYKISVHGIETTVPHVIGEAIKRRDDIKKQLGFIDKDFSEWLHSVTVVTRDQTISGIIEEGEIVQA